MHVRFEVAGESNVGFVRANNEDSLVAEPNVVAVADGVGGRPAGEVASAIAVAAFRESVLRGTDPAEAALIASAVVRGAGAASSLLSTMCSTLTGIAVMGDEVVLAHVGDSRAWLLRDGAVARITEDQTITAKLVAAGEMTPEAAATDPRRATLSQVIGSAKELVPDRSVLTVQAGDRLILATDGILYADPDKLDATLAAPGPPADTVARLVQIALDGGGKDNITVVVADVVIDG